MKFLYSLVLLLTGLHFYAQDYFVPYRKGKLWGYADVNGKVKVTPVYDSVSFTYYNFRWKVFKNKKVGVINQKGEEVLKPEYDSIFEKPVHSRYHEFILYKNGKMGFANWLGELVLPVTFADIIKVEDESFNRLELKFFVKNEPYSHYKLIDEAKNQWLDSIQDFNQMREGFCHIKQNQKWGIYSVLTKQWKIKPTYDSIAVFDYLDFYKPKSDYKDVQYFAIKNGFIYLISNKWDVVPTKETSLKYFFEEFKNEEYDEVVSHLVDVNDTEVFEEIQLEENDNKFFSFQAENGSFKKIKINKQKGKYSFQVNSLNQNNEIFFDAIQLFRKDEESFDSRYALVKKNEKWFVFSIINNVLVSTIGFQSFTFLPNKRGLLLIKNKNKVGLFKFENTYHEELSVFIAPAYDEFIESYKLQSIDHNYNCFNVYLFKNKSEMIPVGENNLLFSSDAKE